MHELNVSYDVYRGQKLWDKKKSMLKESREIPFKKSGWATRRSPLLICFPLFVGTLIVLMIRGKKNTAMPKPTKAFLPRSGESTAFASHTQPT